LAQGILWRGLNLLQIHERRSWSIACESYEQEVAALMKNIQHVLFPVDFSPRCVHGAPYVKEMVMSHKAKLTLLHVAEIPLYWYETSWEAAGTCDALEEGYRTGRQNLTNFACEYFNDLAKLTSVQTACERGDPGYAILAHAQRTEADLIMIPTQGYSPFRSFLIGSTAARVLHRAECPVWTGAHFEKESALPHPRIKNVLCAIDLERESLSVVESAVTLARTFSAQLRLVHCIPVAEGGPAESFVLGWDRFLADSAREQMAKIQGQAGTDFTVCLEGGSIPKVVRDAAIRYEADIVVIGRGHVRVPFSRLRTNAYAIIRESPCPVLSV
jgi:nucleotide-binding universal stress UspA family protein